MNKFIQLQIEYHVTVTTDFNNHFITHNYTTNKFNMVEKEVMRGECSRFKSLSELANKGTCVNVVVCKANLVKC